MTILDICSRKVTIWYLVENLTPIHYINILSFKPMYTNTYTYILCTNTGVSTEYSHINININHVMSAEFIVIHSFSLSVLIFVLICGWIKKWKFNMLLYVKAYLKSLCKFNNILSVQWHFCEIWKVLQFKTRLYYMKIEYRYSNQEHELWRFS